MRVKICRYAQDNPSICNSLRHHYTRTAPSTATAPHNTETIAKPIRTSHPAQRIMAFD